MLIYSTALLEFFVCTVNNSDEHDMFESVQLQSDVPFILLKVQFSETITKNKLQCVHLCF
jgi:hypothetical protein